jgi:hypothetical protein
MSPSSSLSRLFSAIGASNRGGVGRTRLTGAIGKPELLELVGFSCWRWVLLVSIDGRVGSGLISLSVRSTSSKPGSCWMLPSRLVAGARGDKPTVVEDAAMSSRMLRLLLRDEASASRA